MLLGSRDKLCINESLTGPKEKPFQKSNTELRSGCKAMNEAGGCMYNSRKDKAEIDFPQDSLDIEDLKEIGEKLAICPFFHNQEKSQAADMIVVPYTYILSKAQRKANNIDLKNSVIIVDEAHNIGQAAEDAFSFEMSSTMITTIMKELKLLLTLVESGNGKLKSDPDEIIAVLHFLSNFYNAITNANLRRFDERIGNYQQDRDNNETRLMRDLRSNTWVLGGDKIKGFMD